MGSRVTSLIVLGMMLFVVGVLYMVVDVMVTDHLIARFWVSTPYMEFMRIEWHVVPTIIFMLSLMCFIFAGMSKGGHREVQQ